MANKFATIRQEIETQLKAEIPEISVYRLELLSPSATSGQMSTSSLRVSFNEGGGAEIVSAALLLSYAVTVQDEEEDVVANDRLVYLAKYVAGVINHYSRCGNRLNKEVLDIGIDIESGYDTAREDEDQYVWSFLQFEIEYQDEPELSYNP